MNVNFTPSVSSNYQSKSNHSYNKTYSRPAFRGRVNKVLISNAVYKKTLYTLVATFFGASAAKFLFDKTKQKSTESIPLESEFDKHRLSHYFDDQYMRQLLISENIDIDSLEEDYMSCKISAKEVLSIIDNTLKTEFEG